MRLPTTIEELEAEQRRIAQLKPPAWSPEEHGQVVAGVFIAFARGIEGMGAAGDPAWVGTVAMRGGKEIARHAFQDVAGATYSPGRLFLRVGTLILRAIHESVVTPDVVFIDGTGRDHPRGAGLAVHVGCLADIPTVGVTDRPLVTRCDAPENSPGSTSPLLVRGELVGYALRVRSNVKPLIVHAGWRTSADVALDVVRKCVGQGRTPEPLRLARQAARKARADGA